MNKNQSVHDGRTERLVEMQRAPGGIVVGQWFSIEHDDPTWMTVINDGEFEWRCISDAKPTSDILSLNVKIGMDAIAAKRAELEATC